MVTAYRSGARRQTWFRDNFHLSKASLQAGQDDPFLDRTDHILGGATFNLGKIGLWMGKAWVGEAGDERAYVTQNHQAFTVIIQAPGCIYTLNRDIAF
jgi:hypothetical protein